MDRGLEQGLTLSAADARQRMDLMRERVLTWDVQAWAAAFMSAAREAGHTVAALSET
jgi:trehalose-6-phosphate synthase